MAEMARRAESHFGAPQDIEWAIAGGQLFLPQSRPITTLPEPAPTPIPVPANPPPAWLMPLLVRVVPPLRKMLKGMVQAVREDRLGQSVDRWYAEWKPDTIASLEAL